MYLLNEFIFNFWVWWYYQFLSSLLKKQRDYLLNLARFTGLFVHLRYLFVPLYQQRNIGARIFSFIFRLGVIIIGLIAELVFLALFIIITITYLILPILPLVKIWLVVLNN
jgi:hypothetical protein